LAGQSRVAVARQLGLTPNNLAVRLHRARQALRKRLEQTCETCPTHGFQSCACPRTTPRPSTTGQAVRPGRAVRLMSENQAGASPKADAPPERQHDLGHRLP
jgi:transposase-like protein